LIERQSRNIAHKAVFGLVLCHTCCDTRLSLKHNEKRKFLLEHDGMIVVKLLLRLYACNQKNQLLADVALPPTSQTLEKVKFATLGQHNSRTTQPLTEMRAHFTHDFYW
jgi:hypothetical protein